MNRSTFERRGLHVAATPLVCLVLSMPLRADEAPANNPNDTPPAGAALDVGFPVQGAVGVDLSRTQFALSAIHLAANTDLIGADVAQVDDVLRSHLGLGEGKGLVVTGVSEDGPAAKAGIRKNDVLIAVGDEEVAGLETLRKSLEASAEKPVSIALIRTGKKQSVDVTPRSTTARFLTSTLNHVAAEPKYRLGLGLAGADDTLRSQLALPAGEGLVVTSIDNDSPAAKAGIMINDVLLNLDGKALSTIEALAEQLQTIADKSVALALLRRGKPATLTVTPEKRADAWQTVEFLDDGLRDLIFVTPQQVGELNIATFVGTIGTDALNFTSTQAKTDLVRQISELEAQVKQLEVSLAAIRAAIDPPASPAPNGGEKTEAK